MIPWHPSLRDRPTVLVDREHGRWFNAINRGQQKDAPLMPKNQRPPNPGELPIRTDEIYVRQEFIRRVGIGEEAFRMARRHGLRVIRTAGRVYVRGADWDAYVLKVSGEPTEIG
ncbi:MAG: hypothetical protein KDA52_09020 [Planctomycetaceae bacterium]|nr:hypothetical protein [Planctomycetaceae bacterium]